MSIESVYSNTARFDAPVALDDEALFRIAPSIFATEAHDSLSDKFRPIPTIDVVNALRKEGFVPVGAKQCVVRDNSKKAFSKHLLRFRKIDGNDYQVGDNVVECLLKNANDGSAAYELLAGLFRIRCKNSLVAQTDTIDTIKVRHSGDALGKVIEGTYRVLGEAENVLTAPQDWGRLMLPEPAQHALAEAAQVLRFGEDKVAPVAAPKLLRPRRLSDNGTDLWTMFNVVQENCIKGGLHWAVVDANNRLRRTTTRQVNGIDQDVKLNKALWVLGNYFAQQMRHAA